MIPLLADFPQFDGFGVEAARSMIAMHDVSFSKMLLSQCRFVNGGMYACDTGYCWTLDKIAGSKFHILLVIAFQNVCVSVHLIST